LQQPQHNFRGLVDSPPPDSCDLSYGVSVLAKDMIPFLSLPPLCSLPESRRITAAPIPGNTAVTVLPTPHEMSPQRHWSLSGTGVNPPQSPAKSASFSPGLLHANPQVAEEALTTWMAHWQLLEHKSGISTGHDSQNMCRTFCCKRAANGIVTVPPPVPTAASLQTDPQTLSPRESPPR
jgi:hypothetical protein